MSSSSPAPTEAEVLLARVIPFQFLPLARRRVLAGRLERRTFAADEVILREGDRSRDVFLLAEGQVEIAGDELEAGHYFGERAALFDCPRQATVTARGEGAVTYSLPALDFLRLIEEEPVFAQALATSLTVKQGIFLGYRRLWARILGMVGQGGFLLSSLLPDYAALHPALHPHLHDDEIDIGALTYAVHRLPEGVTQTAFYYLTQHLPPLYEDPDRKFPAVPTRARRRAAWRPIPGKCIVLLRDGMSDVSDLLTCLCAYATEARKIRRRVRSPELLAAINPHQAGPPATPAQLRALCRLSEPERLGLERLWGAEGMWTRLYEILTHHEDIALECDLQIDSYNASAAERWIHQIREAAAALVDLDAPPDTLDVHIISSNTHSVGNCLSPYVARRRAEILAWGRERYPALCEQPWPHETDLLYALTRHYMDEVPDAYETCVAEERAAGHYRLRSTAFTGIAVDLICAHQIDPTLVDPALPAVRPTRPTLLINVDYAFGQQAEDILANLLYVFGRSVRSVSVLGKAGGLVGDRGDLLLPRATLLQTNDELYPLPNTDLDAADLRALAGTRAVHEGPVLTVAGTLLQDRSLLHFYRRIWRCVGLEMEGSFFARRLVSAVEMGLVPPDVRSRFAYYVSDVPLQPAHNLSAGMAPLEGVPPLYAVTRLILRQILAGSQPPSSGSSST